MLNKKAFTLMELLIATAILGIIASLSVPSYMKAMESSYSNEAKVNLNIVHMGEKIYYLNNNKYWPDDTNSTNLAAINTALSVDMGSKYYTTVRIEGTNNPNPKKYTAKFTRAGDADNWYQYEYPDPDDPTPATPSLPPKLTQGTTAP